MKIRQNHKGNLDHVHEGARRLDFDVLGLSLTGFTGWTG